MSNPCTTSSRAATLLPPRLELDQIVPWAEAHQARTGKWPAPTTPGVIPGTGGEKWKNIDEALRSGHRGLPGGSTLVRLLTERFGVRNRHVPPLLTLEQILLWADAFHARTGHWPTATSGPIPEVDGESWRSVASALHYGYRGLPAGSSLPRLLAERRGHRNRGDLPPLTEEQILAWADEHRRRTGMWPNKRTPGTIPDTRGETWTNVDAALWTGHRGLPGKSSLARLLADRRGHVNRAARPVLTEAQVLAWADAYHRRHGCWPVESAGPIPRSRGDTWSSVDQALRVGLRGLPPGSSLARLLAWKRGYRHRHNRPRLTLTQILRWADAHRARTGQWPSCYTGPVTEAPGENWATIDAMLRRGRRGLPGGSSLICLLAEARGAPHRLHPARLHVEQVLAWADVYRERTGEWPRPDSGPVAADSSVTWCVVNDCLRRGVRGLPGGTTLARFLAHHRGCG
jgi:hypothetical protein